MYCSRVTLERVHAFLRAAQQIPCQLDRIHQPPYLVPFLSLLVSPDSGNMNTSTSLGPFSFDDFLKTPTTASGNDGSELVLRSMTYSGLTICFDVQLLYHSAWFHLRRTRPATDLSRRRTISISSQSSVLVRVFLSTLRPRLCLAEL